MLIFPIQLTTSRIGNFTRLMHSLAICDCYTRKVPKVTSIGRSVAQLKGVVIRPRTVVYTYSSNNLQEAGRPR